MHRLSLLLAIVTVSVTGLVLSSYGQDPQSQPERPPSDATKSISGEHTAHTNYAFIPIEQQDQHPEFSQRLSEITLPPETASALQIVRPKSDLSNQSVSEEIARFALMMGEAAPAGAEIRAHTNYEFLAKANRPPGLPLGSIANNTPHEIRSRYGIPDSGGAGLIVIVDAYDYPTLEADLAKFSSQFGLPSCSISSSCLQVLKMEADILKDTDPRVADCGWSGEAALDVQWAHAIAPQAKLILVEAVSSRIKDMFAAVGKASEIVEQRGGGLVSLSWSFDEFGGNASAGTLGETGYDKYFAHDTVLYFASSGDRPAWVQYPSASPLVVSVGGTDLLRDAASNKILIEKGWGSTGGGNSNFEPRPPFQNDVENISDAGRVTPDIAGPAGLDTSGANGSPVYAGTVCKPYSPGWYSVGGTSLATPIIAAAASFSFPKGGNTTVLLDNIYKQRKMNSSVRDITAGQAGANVAKPGYDKVTGVGVPASIQFAVRPTNQ